MDKPGFNKDLVPFNSQMVAPAADFLSKVSQENIDKAKHAEMQKKMDNLADIFHVTKLG